MENQISTTQTQALIPVTEIPQLAKVGKSPLLPYLPDKLVTSLPETVKAEISHSKLKWSDNEVKERFANRVILFIDPKFSDENTEDQYSDFNIAKSKIIDYSRRSELTESEYLLALDMASKGQLVIDEQKVKIYREINQVNLAEVEQGYIEFKIRDTKYQNAKTEISRYLNPPAPKMTKEQCDELAFENIKKDYHRFKADGKVLATPLFYDLIKLAKGEKIKLSFVEDFLKNYVPEVAEGKLTSGGTSLPKVIKKDVYLEFQNEMISNYVKYLKLDITSEVVWNEHWNRLYKKKRDNES